ncbi:hypothetical protein Q9R46_18550 [Paenibacillus sp. RRE4]|uniref:hypothetical protein n=1 Tax=Paenibacillus sp. RRE4 TaxID=2962587 RepID=UPI0028826066|nr:hypothetical protein [Paenibacillus sp. RRE4]MDT0124670.1 hypothetical protein [Paenibacillus sp. RRE4]
MIAVAPDGVAVENRTRATLVLLLERLLFTAVSVLGDERVPFALRVIVPLKEDNKLSATVMPPDNRETYKVLPLPAGLASCKVAVTLPPSIPKVVEFVEPALYRLPVLPALFSGGATMPGEMYVFVFDV